MRNRKAFELLYSIFFVISEIKASANLNPRYNAFDLTLYEDVLDPEKCQEQLNHIFTRNRILGLRFQGAGIRIPRGILGGNLLDLGDYYQCLRIKEGEENLNIQGKYCSISIPLNQELHFPYLLELSETTEWPEQAELKEISVNEKYLKKIHEYKKRISQIIQLKEETIDRSTSSDLSEISLTVATCIPKTCTTKEYITKLSFNISAIDVYYTENFCRLANDKPWVPADYVAIIIFSVIGFLILLSTCYDLHHIIILKKDPKEANVVYQSFSAYTNTQRLFTFPSNQKAIECLDGIRAMSMLWIILGHTASTLQISNVFETSEWTLSLNGLWLMAATISVDTFFLLSGLLLVYTTSGKFSTMQLIKNVHLFYLRRILRVFPLLATAVLVQASFVNRLDDGPLWPVVANFVHRCRENWWSTLLHIQNFRNPRSICLPHSWYLAIDMQVYILSPLILVWVFLKKKSHVKAWVALTTALIVTLVGSTIYNAIKEFDGAPLGTGHDEYIIQYYIHTFTRASPLLVGMIIGYILYTLRGEEQKFSKMLVVLIWLLIGIMICLVLYVHNAPIQVDWDNLAADVIINTFMRPTWACAVGMMIILCAHGYGGPVNWILSHKVWKLPSRLSYAMYLIHYPLMYVGTATRVHLTNFTIGVWIFTFLAYASLTTLLAIFAMIVVDLPFANIINFAMGQGEKKSSSPQLQTEKNVRESKNGIEPNGISDGVHIEKDEER